MNDDEIELLSVPVRLRRAGREIRMVINGTGSFAAKPDARLIKLLLRARRFNATLADSEGVPFAALAEREGVSRSYFTRLVRLSYLAPDITQAILDGRQPSDLTAEKLLEHSRLPLAWHDQRIVLGFGAHPRHRPFSDHETLVTQIFKKGDDQITEDVVFTADEPCWVASRLRETSSAFDTTFL